MSRSRNIKPALFENELLGQMEGDTVLTFIGLWCEADRVGRLEDRPLRLKAKLFPYRQVSIEGALSQLEEGGFLIRYTVNGEAFIQIVNFEKHQNPHRKEQASDIPPVPSNLLTKDRTCTDLEQTQHRPKTEHARLIPDSLILIPDSRFPQTSKGSSPDGESVVVSTSSESMASRSRKLKPSLESDPDFTAFWTAYPRKVNKCAAFAAWNKANLPTTAVILAAVEAHAASEQWEKEGGKFIPHPTTWLHGERWNDQLSKAKEVSEHADF